MAHCERKKSTLTAEEKKYTPKYVFLRESVQFEWTLQLRRSIIDNHVGSDRDKRFALVTEWTAKELREFASIVGFGYIGCFIQADGVDKTSYQCEATMVPFFPSTSPISQRNSYWRYRQSDKITDVTICSQYDLLYLLLYSCNAKLAPKWQNAEGSIGRNIIDKISTCLLYTSDAADE